MKEIVKKHGNIYTKEIFIEKAFLKHSGKYSYIMVDYIDSKTKIKIICPIHNIFEQRPNDHLNGNGCPFCGGRKINKKPFQEEAREKHNNKYDYKFVDFKGGDFKVKIICPIHDIFEQTPNNHLSGHGCPFCGGSKQKTTEQFIQEAINIHHNLYDYKFAIYINNFINVKINCSIHGIFEQLPSNHLSGSGCPLCANNKKKTKEQFELEAFIIHKGKYTYLDFNYISNKIKGKITCSIHGIFEQRPMDHLKGSGCPKCAKNISKSEIQWLDSLNIPDNKEHRQVKILDKVVDGFDPETNTIYEFYGDFWHGNIKRYNPKDENCMIHKTFGELYQKTLERENFLKNAGYRIISIWEQDFVNTDI